MVCEIMCETVYEIVYEIMCEAVCEIVCETVCEIVCEIVIPYACVPTKVAGPHSPTQRSSQLVRISSPLGLVCIPN